jgi:hypothetical protein
MNDAPNRPVQPPYPLALVVCDHIWRDPYTGKMTILGTFSTIGGDSVPLFHPIITVYAALTDGVGQSRLKVQLVDCDEEREPVFAFDAEYPATDPRAVVEFAFQAQGVKFDQFGEYRLQLWVDQNLAMERRILVVHSPKRRPE